jgi:hypothetical protein
MTEQASGKAPCRASDSEKPLGSAQESQSRQGDDKDDDVSLAIAQVDYQVTQDMIKMLTDIRFRLLAILPPISAAAVALVQAKAAETPIAMAAFGILGFCIVLALLIYELRNSDLYNTLIYRARMLEGVIGFVRYDDQKLKRKASTDTKNLAAAIRGIAEPPPSLPPDFPGGPHRQRAVQYLCLGGVSVSHGGALGLIWGVLLGAWTFPISKGIIVAIFKLTANPQLELADVIAFVIAAVCSAVLTAALWALEDMHGEAEMYPSRLPENSQQQKLWGEAARASLHKKLADIRKNNRAAALLLRPARQQSSKGKPGGMSQPPISTLLRRWCTCSRGG